MAGVNYRDLNPVLVARLTCCQCDEILMIEIPRRWSRAKVNRKAYLMGWRKRMPRYYDFLGVLCPNCVESFSPGGDAWEDAKKYEKEL